MKYIKNVLQAVCKFEPRWHNLYIYNSLDGD